MFGTRQGVFLTFVPWNVGANRKGGAVTNVYFVNQPLKQLSASECQTEAPSNHKDCQTEGSRKLLSTGSQIGGGEYHNVDTQCETETDIGHTQTPTIECADTASQVTD